MLGFSALTIGRELRRNSGGRGYCPRQARRLADARKRAKPRRVKLTATVVRLLLPLAQRRQVRSITFDNGLEFAGHRAMAAALGARVYFARAYASWQRGCNENLNGLLRQYFPKGSDFGCITAAQVRVQERLINRPRARFGGKTPNEVFFGRRANLLAV